MSLEKVGIITKPQGLKGEFRVAPNTLNFSVFKEINDIFIENKKYALQKVSIRSGFVVLKVEGIDDCNGAETLRNKSVFLEFSENVKLDKGEYFISDLIGAQVVVENEVVGKVTAIESFGAADVFTITMRDSTVYFPNARDVVKSFDATTKIVVLDANILSEIAYED